MRRLAPPRQDDHQRFAHGNLAGKPLSSPDSTGFGRTLSKKSLDMALRHMVHSDKLLFPFQKLNFRMVSLRLILHVIFSILIVNFLSGRILGEAILVVYAH